MAKNYNALNSKVAVFESPLVRDSAVTCQMLFWYQIKGTKQVRFAICVMFEHGLNFVFVTTGSNVGAIEVFSNIGSQKTRIVKIAGDTDKQWMQASARIGRIRAPFSLNIESSINKNELGYIAIDDISFLGISVLF